MEAIAPMNFPSLEYLLHGLLTVQLQLFPFWAGFAFVYMDDERDAEDAIGGLDNTEFGRQRRRLCVEWAKVCAPILLFEC